MKVTVITCTRNRPDTMGRVVRSICANDYPNFEYLIIDQSDNSLTARAVRGAAGEDSRIRYLRHPSRGKSRALNLAVGHSQGEVLAVTDDDCEARRDWISELVAEFGDPSVGVVCGRVLPVAHDPRRGWVASFEPAEASILKSHWCSMHCLGVGSNMAWRREVGDRVGPFDEMLGPGAPIPAGEDRDFLYRSLRQRCNVKLSPRPVVINHDFHPWSHMDGPDRYAASLAAASSYWKHIRKGDMVALWWYMADVVGDTRSAAGRILRWQKPLGLGRVKHLIAGAVFSMRYPVDPQQGVYAYHVDSMTPTDRVE